MDQNDARRIAETANALRPDWPIRATMTILADFRHKTPRDVHLAIVWIAYDPTIQTPAILRSDGPWWRLDANTRAGTPELPKWEPAHPSEPLPPAQVAHHAQLAREARDAARKEPS